MEDKFGKLIVISAPSGTGKNSIIQELLKRIPNTTRLITTTTRARRPKEVEGVDYYFLSPEEFALKKNDGDFVETVEYAGNSYGIQKKHITEAQENYSIVFANPDVNGKHSLDRLGIPHVAIFLAPEKLESLHERIIRRGGVDSTEALERIHIAEEEMKQAHFFDKIIVNRDNKMAEAVEEIIGYLGSLGLLKLDKILEI